ncbi:hypothetical protein AAFF_G00049980 [Aldrovandia affinis]|uniref:Uncharacterized protein n=1 Tax=Aldrovandia affinis TaxID=143900 RepID=A0AAD7S1H0_9TELE|nr:hypothetical protein AAFF_G00049980 [Aldrovandia affinis]
MTAMGLENDVQHSSLSWPNAGRDAAEKRHMGNRPICATKTVEAAAGGNGIQDLTRRGMRSPRTSGALPLLDLRKDHPEFTFFNKDTARRVTFSALALKKGN